MEQEPKFEIRNQLNWLIPTVMTLFVIAYHLMYTVYSVRRLELKITDHLTRIRAIEDYIDKVDRKYKVKVVAIDAELVRIEEFCCGEVVEYKAIMKNKAEKLIDKSD